MLPQISIEPQSRREKDDALSATPGELGACGVQASTDG